MAQPQNRIHLRTQTRPCVLACLCLLLACPVLAFPGQKEITQYVQTTLTDKTGLPQNSVNAIAQTRDGYLWFGTEEGLARYDGLRVTVFDTIHNKTLKDNYIYALVAASDGSLWVGSRTGLTRFKDGVFETWLTAQSPIATIVEAHDGKIWVGSLDGLYAIQPSDPAHHIRSYTTQDGLPANSISNIAETTDGTLWVGTGKGLASLDNGRFHPAPLSTDPVFALAASRDGSLWIGTGNSLFRWKDKIPQIVPLTSLPPHSRITTMHEESDGTLWLGFDHSGVALLRAGRLTRYTIQQGLPSDNVTTVFEDREGHLWVGLFESGVVELRGGSFTTVGHREGLSDDMVWTVLQAYDQSLWVGTNSHGLDHIAPDGSIHTYTTRDGLPGDSIYALFEAPDHSLWVGNEEGALSHLQNGHITVYRDPVGKGARLISILPDPSSPNPSSNGLLLAYHQLNGLARFSPGQPPQSQFRHFTLPGLLNTATLGADGSVWVGTDHAGVSRINLATGAVTPYTTQNGLLTNFAQAVYIDRDGVVWAGTSPGGLNRIKDGHITTYSIDQGLFDLTVGAIIEDDAGYLWMTCNKGIYKVSKKELNDYAEGRIPAIHSIVYSAADGLRSVECNFAADPSVWKGASGRLWFATTAGVASVDPTHSQILVHTPSLQIERVLFDQNPLPAGTTVTAGPGTGDLEIQFTAPDFVAPQRIHFRYRLHGSDAGWVDVGERRQAFYTKLPPGKYLFEVQATVGDQGWTSDTTRPGVAQLEIVLKPHFWQTSFFRIACGLLLLLLSAAIYRLRVRYFVERNRLLEDHVSERTAELQLAIRAAEAAHHALHEQASRDSLTGLWNRRSIFEMLAKELIRSQRDQLPVALLMADVDHFKLVNDNHGHLAGDSVLQQVANRIGSLTRSYDFAGRYGGEEFVIVLSNCSLADAFKRAEEFRSAIVGTPIPTAFGSLEITCSFGVAVSSGKTTAEELIHKADEALYSAKRAGRNRVHASTPQDYPVELASTPK